MSTITCLINLTQRESRNTLESFISYNQICEKDFEEVIFVNLEFSFWGSVQNKFAKSRVRVPEVLESTCKCQRNVLSSFSSLTLQDPLPANSTSMGSQVMTTNGVGVESSNSTSNNVSIMAFSQQPGLALQYSQVC